MDGGKMQHFKADEVIIREGEESSGLYKIVSGKVMRYLNYGKESEYLVGALGETYYFGEMSLLTGKKNEFTVVAFTDTLVMHVDEAELEAFVRSYPTNAIDVMKQMARNCEALNKHMDMMSDEIRDLIGRVSELIEQAEQESGIRIRQELKRDLLMYRQKWLENTEKTDAKILSQFDKKA